MGRVGIIGAGVSGLAACKHAVEKGLHVTMFEAEDGIGGVWACTLDSIRLQSPKSVYQFSSCPWPKSMAEVKPGHRQVMEYLESYARHCSLVPCIRFGCRVVSVQYVGVAEEQIMAWEMWAGNGEAFCGGARGKWHLTVQQGTDGLDEIYEMDFPIDGGPSSFDQPEKGSSTPDGPRRSNRARRPPARFR